MKKKTKRNKWKSATAIGTVFVVITLISVCVMSAIAAEGSSSEVTSSEQPHFDRWAKPRDMSNFSRYIPPIDKKVVPNETSELLYPGLVVWNSSRIVKEDTSPIDAVFHPNGSVSVTKSQEAKKGQGSKTTPDVRITGGYYYWYWVQDTWFSNQFDIYNYGPSTASGKVIFWSWEDGYGYYNTFSNLAPYTSTTVTVPFQVISSYSSVGIKPIAVEVRVDPYDTTTDFVWMPTDGIEKYNNDANHLSDPDGGDSLETSDLYHFPFSEGYAIISEAASAGDDTTTPYETAYQINTYVNGVMHYTLDNPDTNYTAADLWIKDNGYDGCCDEYATLFVAFDRSLGIPSRYYLLQMNCSGNSTGHGIAEIWNGNQWIHSDPTWNVFDNPQVYNQSGCSHIHVWRMCDADDSIYSGDPYGDQLLHFWEDFGIKEDLGELDRYN